jgi:3-oxoadipate enol-lactonase
MAESRSTLTATTDVGALAYWERPGPSSEPLLLIHSVGTSKRLFEESVAAWPKGRRLLVPDILGHGESCKPPHEFTISDHARALVDFARGVGVEKAHVVGTSLGALIALEIAATDPGFTRSLVLNGCPGWHLESQRMARLRANTARLIDENGLPRRVQAFGAMNRTEPEFVEALNVDLQRAGRWLLSSQWAIAAFDIIPRLGRVVSPTLVLMGEHDWHVPTSYQLEAGIRGSRFQLMPNAGHLSPYDAPEDFAQIVSRFCEEEVGIND